MGNQWNPSEQNRQDRYIFGAGQEVSSDLQRALLNFHEEEQQRRFNTALFKGVGEDAVRKGYIPVEALRNFNSMKDAEQAGTLAGIMRKSSEEVQRQQQQIEEQKTNAQSAEANARANLLWAQGQSAWTGQGEDKPLTLTPEEIATGAKGGRIPVRTSPNSFQWLEDPGNPVNAGEPTPIDKFGRRVDPNDPNGEVVGLMQPNKVIKYLQKPTDVQTLINAGVITGTPKPPASPTPTPSGTQNASVPAGKVLIKGPDGQLGFIRAEQLQQALAKGATLAQ